MTDRSSARMRAVTNRHYTPRQEDTMFELFDHTADLGLRVRAESLDDLFRDAATALTHCLVGKPESIQATTEVICEINSTDIEYLFFDWLSELLYRFDADGFAITECDISVSGTLLRATLKGEPFDPARHEYSHEVKAITYHRLRVEQCGENWVAEVIVDI